MLRERDKWMIRKSEWPAILRCCGYGRPDLFRALRTVQNSVTLIAQGGTPALHAGSFTRQNEGVGGA